MEHNKIQVLISDCQKLMKTMSENQEKLYFYQYKIFFVCDF